MLLGWLRSSLTHEILEQVVSAKTSFELWKTLRQSFSATSKARLSELRCQLQNITKGSSSCLEYFTKLRSVADELSFIEEPISDSDLHVHILQGLGRISIPSWLLFKLLHHVPSPILQFSYTVMKLLFSLGKQELRPLFPLLRISSPSTTPSRIQRTLDSVRAGFAQDEDILNSSSAHLIQVQGPLAQNLISTPSL